MDGKQHQKQIYVYADWHSLGGPNLLGMLNVSITRGKEVFWFEYNEDWLNSTHVQVLDPDLKLYRGPQYLGEDKSNFGLFLDSSPDRWGRMLMNRREAASARQEERSPGNLLESDFLLGVYDGHRMGALRFKLDPEGDFLDNNSINAAPPWTKLRDLEFAGMHVEEYGDLDHPDYLKWLNLLIAPGSSLGGARPKSSVTDTQDRLWIAKFPGKADQYDVGAWEMIVHTLARRCNLNVPETQIEKFSDRFHTFLSKRFDRITLDQRIHFASAMTLLGYTDGTNASDGVSYLELAEFIIRNGARVREDLQELWKRIVFFICVSNTDDHLRNHGFMLTDHGWILSPAYDINPDPAGSGLSLNISENDNSLDLTLAREVSEYFRIPAKVADEQIKIILSKVRQWRSVASEIGISSAEQELMSNAFRMAEE